MTTHQLRVISIATNSVLMNGLPTTTRPTCVAINDDVTLKWVADWDDVPQILDFVTVTFTPQPPKQKRSNPS